MAGGGVFLNYPNIKINNHCRKAVLSSVPRKKAVYLMLLDGCDCTLSPAGRKDRVEQIINK